MSDKQPNDQCPTCGRTYDAIAGLERLRMRADAGLKWRWLSPRMQDVFAFVGKDGKPYHEIADILGVSPKTIEEYARRIRDRLGETGKPRDVLVRCYAEMYGV